MSMKQVFSLQVQEKADLYLQPWKNLVKKVSYHHRLVNQDDFSDADHQKTTLFLVLKEVLKGKERYQEEHRQISILIKVMLLFKYLL